MKKKQRNLKEISNKLFAIKITLAMLNDFRFIQGYENDVLMVKKIRKPKETSAQLRSISITLNQLADEILIK